MIKCRELTLLTLKTKYSRQPMSIILLLVAWHLTFQGHRQPRYWLSAMWQFSSFSGVNLLWGQGVKCRISSAILHEVNWSKPFWKPFIGKKTWWRHQMENIFRVTGHLCGEFTVPGEFSAQRPDTRSFDGFFDRRLNKRLRNTCEAGDFRRYRAHYDVIVMPHQKSCSLYWAIFPPIVL